MMPPPDAEVEKCESCARSLRYSPLWTYSHCRSTGSKAQVHDVRFWSLFWSISCMFTAISKHPDLHLCHQLIVMVFRRIFTGALAINRKTPQLDYYMPCVILGRTAHFTTTFLAFGSQALASTYLSSSVACLCLVLCNAPVPSLAFEILSKLLSASLQMCLIRPSNLTLNIQVPISL